MIDFSASLESDALVMITLLPKKTPLQLPSVCESTNIIHSV